MPVDTENAGILIGTCINENAIKLIIVGILFPTAVHDIVEKSIIVHILNKSLLNIDDDDENDDDISSSNGGKKNPNSFAFCNDMPNINNII